MSIADHVSVWSCLFNTVVKQKRHMQCYPPTLIRPMRLDKHQAGDCILKINITLSILPKPEDLCNAVLPPAKS